MKLSDLAVIIISTMICAAITTFGMHVAGFVSFSGQVFTGVTISMVGLGLLIFLSSGEHEKEPLVYFVAQDGITIEEVVDEKLKQLDEEGE